MSAGLTTAAEPAGHPAHANPVTAWRPGAADVIAFSIVFTLILCLPAILNDGDTLWQIRTGDWILGHLAIPAVDPFSFTAGDRPWTAHEWLAETLLAAAWRIGGMQGVMILAAGAVGLTAAILTHHLRRFLPAPYATLGVVVALANAAPSMLARPHLLAWPCLALWCGGLVAARAKRVTPSWWLLPVMLLWVNLHGSFMVGLLLAPAFLAEALLDPATDRRRTLTGWVPFIAASWLLAPLNPSGLDGMLFPFHMLAMTSTAWIGEWQSTDFSRPQPLELMILAGLALGLSGRLRLPPVRLLILLGLVHVALSHARNEQLLGVVGVLVLAQPSAAALGRPPAAEPRGFWNYVSRGGALLAAIAVAVRLAVPLGPDRTGEAFAATLEHVPSPLRARPVLNEYGLGGKLIFAGVRPFIDSRADLYGDAFLTQYRDLIEPRGDVLARTLAHYDIGWTIFPARMPIVTLLDQQPGWHRLYDGDGIVVHARDGDSRR